MGPARHNPSAGYSFSFYAVTVLSSFSDSACSGLQTGNPDMAIHQCCYNLSGFISFWILSPKWKGRGGRRTQQYDFPIPMSSPQYSGFRTDKNLKVKRYLANKQPSTTSLSHTPSSAALPAPPLTFKRLIYFFYFFNKYIQCTAVGVSGWLIFFLYFRIHGAYWIFCYRTCLGLDLVLESRHEPPLEIELFEAALWIEEF